MKILILSKVFRDGEAITEYVKELAKSAVEKEHQVTILSFDDKSYYSVHDQVNVERVPLNFEGDNIYNWSMILNNELKREATRLMQENEYDIIHANDWTTIPGATTLSQHTQKPFLLTIHSTENQRGFQADHSEVISELEYQGTREAEHIITTNHDTKNSVLFDLSLDNSKVTVADPYDQNWTETVLNKYKDILKQEEKVKN